VPVPVPVAAAPADANPFGGFALDEPAAPGRVEAEPEEPSPRRGRAPAADLAKPWKIAVYCLAAYALLMTILALYGLTRSPSGPEHPPPQTKKR